MLHVDVPTLPEIRALVADRSDACVSIYVGTTPQTQHVGASRTAFRNLARTALEQLEAAGFDKRRRALLEEEFDALAEDEAFWRLQANSLAILATPDDLKTFRFATAISDTVQVADRFHIKPLLRAIAFPQHAYVLALSENAVRLLEIFADHPPVEVKVPHLPKNAAEAVGRSSVNNLTQGTRIANAHGETLLLKQFARRVDAALRPVLAGRETPLILAATEPLGPIFRSAASYPALAANGIAKSPDHLADHEIEAAARAVLDGVYVAEVAAARAAFFERRAQGRATTDLAQAARAATAGAVEMLLVDIDETVPGAIDDLVGELSLVLADDAKSYDVLDEIAGRALATGARILGVRKADLPDAAPLAAILRYAI